MMKKLLTATAIGLALLTWHTSCTQQPKAPEAFTPIKVETPARPAGQEDVIQLVTPKIDTVRVGFIGLGMRGPGAVARWTHIPGTKIVALCDLLPERVEKSQEILKNADSLQLLLTAERKMHGKTLTNGMILICIHSYRLEASCCNGCLCHGTWQACSHRSSCRYDIG
mgnify:CR=1 FL=1